MPSTFRSSWLAVLCTLILWKIVARESTAFIILTYMYNILTINNLSLYDRIVK
jgi:hypothetical protein